MSRTKTYLLTCAPNEDFNPGSLIRVFFVSMKHNFSFLDINNASSEDSDQTE